MAQAPVTISEGPSAPVVCRWLGPGKRALLEVVSMVVTWWIVAFLPSVIHRLQ